MPVSLTLSQSAMCLVPFDKVYADVIAGWVSTDEELHWLAPSTRAPLTAEKVAAWGKPGGESVLMMCDSDSHPLGYAELNPMRRRDRLWIGHVIIRPDRRGRGIGGAFVHLLLTRAFEEHSVARVLLIVFPSNTSAIRCYVRAGFEIAGEEFHRFGESGPKHRLLRLEAQSR